MDLEEPSEYAEVRERIRQICARFPARYWSDLEPDVYPTQFVEAIGRDGWLGAVIPEQYGGLGLGLGAASAILEEVSASGANPVALHAQMYVMSVIVRHGSEQQKRRVLPQIASGAARLQVFGVTEALAGSDTLNISTTAVRTDDGWVVSGEKNWTSRALYSDYMVLLARTKPREEAVRKTDGLSLFLVDLRLAREHLEITPVPTLTNHAATRMRINDLPLGPATLIGDEHRGFDYMFAGMNAERILVAAECVGDGRYFIARATEYATSRIVFDRPIGSNQGIQFPLARAHMAISGASLMRWKAAMLFEAGKPCGPEANMAKYLASEASWLSANACIDTFGGEAFAVANGIERKFRETRVYGVAPISNNLIQAYVGQHVLGMPRSY